MELTVNVPNTYEINMQRVVDLLRAQGHFAYVEQTGGGCATIFAGPTRTDAYGDQRYHVAAGPGWFEGGKLTGDGIGDTRDFYVGFDGEDDKYDPVKPGMSEGQVADLIIEWLGRSVG